MVLIGSDCPHLITPIEPVRLGPPGGPAAVRTRLGWTLQGPAQEVNQQTFPTAMSLHKLAAQYELYSNVEKLWKMDILPYQNEKILTRSKQDQECINFSKTKTVRVDVNGIQRYATPLLRAKGMPCLHAPKEAGPATIKRIEIG